MLGSKVLNPATQIADPEVGSPDVEISSRGRPQESPRSPRRRSASTSPVGRLELERHRDDPAAVAHAISLPAETRQREVGEFRVQRGGTGEGTPPHVSHVSHTLHRMVERSRLAMRGVNGRGWDRTSDLPRVNRP